MPFTYWQDSCRVATHRQCSASVVTKCRKFMPDSAVVVRKYILILWSPLLHWWSKKAPGSEVKGASDLKLISRSSQCDSASSSWCVLQDFFFLLHFIISKALTDGQLQLSALPLLMILLDREEVFISCTYSLTLSLSSRGRPDIQDSDGHWACSAARQACQQCSQTEELNATEVHR